MSKLHVDEIASKTGATDAMTIDSSGRVKRSVIPAWYCVRTPSTTHTISASNSDIADWKSDSSGKLTPLSHRMFLAV